MAAVSDFDVTSDPEIAHRPLRTAFAFATRTSAAHPWPLVAVPMLVGTTLAIPELVALGVQRALEPVVSHRFVLLSGYVWAVGFGKVVTTAGAMGVALGASHFAKSLADEPSSLRDAVRVVVPRVPSAVSRFGQVYLLLALLVGNALRVSDVDASVHLVSGYVVTALAVAWLLPTVATGGVEADAKEIRTSVGAHVWLVLPIVPALVVGLGTFAFRTAIEPNDDVVAVLLRLTGHGARADGALAALGGWVRVVLQSLGAAWLGVAASRLGRGDRRTSSLVDVFR